MGIIYLISVLILLISFILVKKSEKKIEIISFTCISIVLLFCYNTLICFILTFFTIHSELWLLTIINILISAIFIIKILKNKQIQKFNFNKIDIIYISLIILAVIVISYANFGFPLEVNYETGDPSVHYLTAVKFAEERTLMPNAELDEVYGDLSVRKSMSYVNSGLLMKCFGNKSELMSYYNIFASFSIITLLLTGITIYSTLKHFSKNKEHNLFAFIVSLLCLLGYPLNSFLFGFEYLSMGLLVLCVIIDMVYYNDNKLLNFSYIVIIFALLNFGLFFSYYMFVPFVYPALWIYFCIKNYNEKHKIISKELIILLVITLLLPFVLGYIYHLAPNIYSIIIKQNIDASKVWDYSNYIAGDGFAVDGYIYTNVYSNMLLLLPLTIYFFIKKAKNKQLKEEIFLGLILVFVILFIEILLIGNSFEKVSMYYLSKNYFALWIILAFTNYKALLLIYDKSKYLSRLFLYSYLILMIICTAVSAVKMEYFIRNPYERIWSVMDIFGANKTILLDKPKEFNQKEIDILTWVDKNLDYNKQIEFVTDENAYYWQYVLLSYVNKEEYFINNPHGQYELTTKWFYTEEKITNSDYYMVYFNKSKKFSELKGKLFENAEIIYENEAGGVLKY